MGGGDLNLKKSWHPHTMKNQERVWKAEQQKAAEDRKMAELQRELKEERERELLQRTAEESGAVEKKMDAKLDWMYKGPGGHVSREEYLLGRKIDAAFEQLEKAEVEEKNSDVSAETLQQNKPVYTIEHEINPESVVRRDPANIQVDMRRKLLEDPLLLIRQREEQTKREVTSNPVKMKQLQQLISAIKSKKDKKRNKKRKKKHSKRASSSSESESDDRRSKRKKKSKTRKKAESSSSSSDSSSSSSSSSSSEDQKRKKKLKKDKYKYKEIEKNSKNIENEEMMDYERCNRNFSKRRTEGYDDSIERKQEPYRSQRSEEHKSGGRSNKWNRERDFGRREERHTEKDRLRRGSRDRFEGAKRSEEFERRHQERYSGSRPRNNKHRSMSRSRSQSRERRRHRESSKGSNHNDRSKGRLSESEMEKMRQEMMDAARKRDKDRKENVQRYEEERRREEEIEKDVEKFRRGHLVHAASKGSVEDRVKSRVSSMQRGSSHMETNFARK